MDEAQRLDSERRLDRLVGDLGLLFVDAKEHQLEDGWYLWRNSVDWPMREYKFVEVVGGEMKDEEPTDSYGHTLVIVWCKPYGQLAGPIIDR